MREIKFRGRSCDKWLYGSLHVNESGQPAISTPAHFVFRCVAPETVGQYTGLKDSKGREIYEGDILHCKNKNPYWSPYDHNVVVSWGSDCWNADHRSLYECIMHYKTEVIGNINDNPELLTVAPK